MIEGTILNPRIGVDRNRSIHVLDLNAPPSRGGPSWATDQHSSHRRGKRPGLLERITGSIALTWSKSMMGSCPLRLMRYMGRSAEGNHHGRARVRCCAGSGRIGWVTRRVFGVARLVELDREATGHPEMGNQSVALVLDRPRELNAACRKLGDR